MLVCANCHYQFRYKEALPFSWKTRVGHECPNCHKTQYYSAKSRKTSLYMTLIGVIIIMFLNMLDVSFPIVFSIALFLIAFFLFISPFTMELSNEEEPLW
ncbi:TIGR04104 family putative zinc finger protein [Alkalibacillus aidingensis]|uniref:TIGR04104 family putative zinc finger protein n=1 Tax=Alkalibacillus aidingensis TaxID=2747607 RepID=UPI001660F0B2|nr:TIGR04104 family putative zinc finger protein [Alkalibacillus aidingensis]